MKREILRSAMIQQGRTQMNESEFRHFLSALGCKTRKDSTMELRLDTSCYEDENEKMVYTVNWRVATE